LTCSCKPGGDGGETGTGNAGWANTLRFWDSFEDDDELLNGFVGVWLIV